MPFSVREMLEIQKHMAENIAYVAENYKSHVGLVKEGMKVFKKLNSKLSQTNLIRWME